MTALVRNPRVDASFLLTGIEDASRSKAAPFLADFPSSYKDLNAYDLLIIGDVPASFFAGDKAKWVAQFVNDGGGLVFLAGRVHAPASWVGADTVKPMLELLPVEVQAVRFPKMSEATTEGWKPVLTRAGELTEMLNLGDNREENLEVWKTLPDMYWFYPAAKLKPGAVVLLAHPKERLGDDPMPLVALQSVGRGQVLYLGVEETWRWLFNKQDEKDFFARFWGQAVYRIGLSRDLGEKQAQLMLDQPDPVKNRPATVYARLYDENFQPLKDKEVRATLEHVNAPPGVPLADPKTVVLHLVPGQDGLYQAPLANDREGRFALNLQPVTGARARLDYQVTVPLTDEMAQIGLQAGPLAEAAEASGGAFYREEDLHRLLGRLQKKTVDYEVRYPVSPWNWLGLLAFVGLVTLEWLVRKFSNLS